MIIEVSGLEKWNEKQREFITLSCKKLGPVLSSELWKDAICSAQYSQNRGHNGESIYEMIVSGADDKRRAKDADIDLTLIPFYRNRSSTIAYTYLGDYRTWLNSYYLNVRLNAGIKGEAQFSNTIIHELMHRAYGFTHNAPYANTVPYKIGHITEIKYIEYYKKHPIAPEEVPLINPEKGLISFEFKGVL